METLNSIKHFSPCLILRIFGGMSITYKENLLSKFIPLCLLCFMTRNLSCIEASDKKLSLVCTVGVVQGDFMVQIV